MQAGGFAACGNRHQARQLLGVDVVGPQEVVHVLAAVLADEQGAHLLRELEVVGVADRSEEHTSELQSPCNLVCRLLLEKKKNKNIGESLQSQYVSALICSTTT